MAGFKDYKGTPFVSYILPIIPKGEPLSEASGLTQDMLGKIPGLRNPDTGQWAGFDWPRWKVFDRDLDAFAGWYANRPCETVAINARELIAVDSDGDNMVVAAITRETFNDTLGWSVERVREGSFKFLRCYRLVGATQLTKKRDVVQDESGTRYPCEILAHGQQWLMEGEHPSGVHYDWVLGVRPVDLKWENIPEVTAEKVLEFRLELRKRLLDAGFVAAKGKLSAGNSAPGQQHPIGADHPGVCPDMALLERALAAVPCDCDELLEYDDWLQFVIALKVASGGSEDFYDHFVAPWAAVVPDNVDILRGKWESIDEAYLGWDYVASVAQARGFVEHIAAKFEILEPPRKDDQPANSADVRPKRLRISSDVEIARRVADDLHARHGEVVFSEGDFWFYDKTHWRRIEKHDLRRTVHNYDGAQYFTGISMSTIRLNKAHGDSIIHEMSAILARLDFFADAPAGINCDSGFIRFADDGRPSLEAHDREHRRRHVLKGSWISDRIFYDLAFDDSLLRRLIEGVFRGDPDNAEKMALVQEIAGAAALGYGTKLQQPKAVILAGATAENGKSQILDLFRGVLPPDAVASIPAARMGDERFTPCLIGKHLNAADELSGAAIASDTFKAIVTGEPVTGREVYRVGVTFRPVAQHVFCTNTLPSFAGGMNRGVQRRLLVIPFNRVIPQDERVERIGQRIGEEEASHLLFWAVEGASRLIRQRGFTVPSSSETALDDWLRAADPVLAWIETNVSTVGPQSPDWGQAKVKSAEAYSHFKRFAIAEGYREITLPAFNGFVQRLKANRPTVVVTHTRTGNWLTGIRIPDFDREALFGVKAE